MNNINNSVNIGTRYNYTILGKENTHKKYLYNEINSFINGKGIPTEFDIGNNKITMNVETKKMAKMVSDGLKKLGINLAKNQK